jgi:hypothetical protein
MNVEVQIYGNQTRYIARIMWVIQDRPIPIKRDLRHDWWFYMQG